MSLPVLAKTWLFNVNQAIAASGVAQTTQRAVWLAIVNSMLGFASMPWTCSGSSNSVAAGMDGVNRWLTGTNLVWATPPTAHSWIVLRQVGIATNFEVCIDLNVGGTPTMGSIIISPSAGFTGGTTGARPTATDEIVLIASGPIGGIFNTVDNNVKIHAMQSSDGQCTRIMCWSQNISTTLMIFDRAANPVSGWTNPSASFAFGANSSTPTITIANLTTSPNGRGRGTSTMNLYMTVEGYTSTILPVALTVPNDLSGEWPMFPLGIASTTALNRGRHGSFYDLWYGITAAANGDTYPADASRQFAQLGNLIFPWNGSTPLIT